MEYYGYAGNILYVNLTTGDIEKKPLDLELATKFIGSCGLNYRLAYDLIQPDTDPLSPESPILIGAGPLVGTLAPGSGQIQGTIKFPLPASEDNRYYIGSGSAGSQQFGVMLRCAGYDHLVILGRAKTPVYLRILDDEVEICDASHLWGKKDIYESIDELTSEYGRCGVMTIGAAGENLITFAFASVDGISTIGRNGFGAVMGSKNLKAIVVRGTRGIRIADPKRFMRTVNNIYERARGNPYFKLHHEVGMHAGWDFWKDILNPGQWPKAKAEEVFSIDRCRELITHNDACTACILGCKSSFDIKEGKFAGQLTHRGVLLNLTWACQVLDTTDLGIPAKLQEMCNRSGMCAVAFRALAFTLASLFEKGVITEEDTDGLRVSRTYSSFADLADKIIHREGFGNTFAEGWFAASRKVGIDLTKMLSIVKGAGCIYDARNAKMDPRIFAMVVNPRGAHHPQCHWTTSIPQQPLDVIRAEAENLGISKETVTRIFDGEGFNLGRLTCHVQDRGMAIDCLGLCVLYPLFGFPINMVTLAELFSAATGIEVTPTELKQAGERAFNMLKVLNVRQGFSRKDDAFPEVWFQPKETADGIEVLMDYYKGKTITRSDAEKILDDYYDERGWDIDKGIPTQEKLIDLGLAEFSR